MEISNNFEEIQPINVDSLIWTEKDCLTNQDQNQSFRVYTTGKSIQNNYVLQHIKPDYGSLGQFLKDVGISKDILLHNRKKKLDQQQDIEQKKIRQNLKDKKLEQIIKQGNVTTQQKAIASKMIVENLFQKNFGLSLTSFCLQNGKPQNNKINYSNIADLTDMLDRMMQKPHNEIEQFHELKKVDYPSLSRNKNVLSSKQIISLGLKQRLSIINHVKQQYSSLKKFTLQPPSESQVYETQNHTVNLLSFDHEEVQFHKIIQKIKFIKLESIHFITLSNIKISDDAFCFLLDFFRKIQNSLLSQLRVQNVQFHNMDKIVMKIKQFIENTKLKKIKLINIGLKSKDFCIICLGIGTKLNFEYFGLKNNDIGQVAIKCLNVLIKFHKSIKFDLSGNPIQRELIINKRYKNCFISM